MSGFGSVSRGQRLQSALDELLAQVMEIEAAAVVSFDGLPMASALPETMNEDRVAAMSAALLSLGEKAAEGLGRGDLSQVFVEGQHGTVFLVACESEAVLVSVASTGAKTGLVLYEVRRTAASIAAILANDLAIEVQPSWEAPTPEVSADFVQALADAEAAYEAHRAESAVFQTMPYTSVVPDLNLVYTPHSAAAHELSEPGQVSYLDPQIPVSSTDPVLSPPPQWALNVARDSDAS